MSALLFISGIGPTEVIIILVLALLLFGGRKIPQLARDLGSGIREFRKTISDSTKELPDDSDTMEEEAPVARKKKKKTRA